MDKKTITKIENLPKINANIKKCVFKTSKDGEPFYRADVEVANNKSHWSFSVYICGSENDNEIVLTDSQWFLDFYVSKRDDLNLYENELKKIKKIIKKYAVIHKYNEDTNGFYKVINVNDIENGISNFIECLKEISIVLKMETNEQIEVAYEKSIKEYENIKKQKNIEKVSDVIKIIVFVVAILALFIFAICIIKNPLYTIFVLMGIGIIALAIKAIIFLCTFWWPGGDLWRM